MLVSIQSFVAVYRPTLRYKENLSMYACTQVNLTTLLYHPILCNSTQIAHHFHNSLMKLIFCYSGYIHWCSVLSITGLRHIPVILRGVTPDSFRYMMEHQEVESIEFMSSDATTEQVEAIFHGLRYNTSLHELDIPSTRPPVDMSILSASLTVNNTLRDLTLSCDLDDHAMEQLSVGLRANRSVTKLKLRVCITDTGVHHLATMLAANRTIRELRLSSDHKKFISDHAIEQLSAGLRANKSVTILILNCHITDAGVQHLATMLAVNNTLRNVHLSSTSISDNGVCHLSRALQNNSSVTHLFLINNKFITNTGAVALGEMLRVNKSLRVINLRNTSVGEEGATALMEGLQHNQVLNELWLPQGLKEYCKKHTLYGSVKSTKFEFLLKF